MNNDIKLNYDDVSIVPEVISEISSRSECIPYDKNGFLPIFAAPMSSVVSLDNNNYFNDSKILTVIPRTYPLEKRIDNLLMSLYNFTALSLKEAEDVFINDLYTTRKFNFIVRHGHSINLCIDLANGHMKKLLDTVKKIKDKWGDNVVIMTGNIANPETYIEYENAGVDYVRCSIGSGNLCSTASNTGTFYAPFSLLKEMYDIKKKINGKCKIIADGGIKGFRDIQKALLYADYVMIGSLFNKAIESAGKTTYGKFYFNINGYKIFRPFTTLFKYGRIVPKEKYDKIIGDIKLGKVVVWKECYGMSTKKAQQEMNEANGIKQEKLKTAEGLVKYQKVEYSISGWAENETDYLRSAMSYTNSRTLDEFKNKKWIRLTQIKYNN